MATPLNKRRPMAKKAHRQPGMPVQPPTQQEGVRAAWRYFRLACHALVAPLWERYGPRLDAMLRWMDARAGHMYLLLCAGLYGYAALAFLVSIPGLAAGRSGLPFVDEPLMHALWGLAALTVCLSQVGALVGARLKRHEWTIWRTSAVLTAMWAMAYQIVVVLVSFEVHSYGGILVWGFIVGIHLIMVRNHPVPQEAALAVPETHTHHLSPEAEADLLTRMHHFADADADTGESTPTPVNG